jgi:hypothetical protein
MISVLFACNTNGIAVYDVLLCRELMRGYMGANTIHPLFFTVHHSLFGMWNLIYVYLFCYRSREKPPNFLKPFKLLFMKRIIKLMMAMFSYNGVELQENKPYSKLASN